MNYKPSRIALFLTEMTVVTFLLCWQAMADETKTDQIPKDYKTAQEIIRKKNIDGRKGSYYLMFPPWGPALDAAVRDRRNGKSGVVNKYPEALSPTTSGERPDASIPAIAWAMLRIPPPPPRDYKNEPGVQFAEGVSQEFIAWATQRKK